jgi:hypothetical protein
MIWQERRVKKAIIPLLRCLIVLCLLTLAASTSYQLAPVSPVPPAPIGAQVVVTAPGFDTCVAPPASLLNVWWKHSPYRWLNVYLGGVSMFPTCGGKDLTPAWVRAVYKQGWSLLPTWVGPQAPCAVQRAVMSSNALLSYTQGQAEADAAIKAMNRLGFSRTAPVYFDMEHFNLTTSHGSLNKTCIRAVNAFLSGWGAELSASHHLAGVYASASDYPVLARTIALPAIWIAGGGPWEEGYSQTCTIYGNHYLSDDNWSNHQRIYQYTGGHNETYGRQTWNIDSDCADAPMVGHLTATVALQLPSQSP